MINIVKIAELITLNHGKNICYHRNDEKWIIFTNIQYLRAKNQRNQKILHYIEHADEYVDLFRYNEKDLLVDINKFLETNNDIKEKIIRNVTITRFVKAIKDNKELFDRWINFFVRSIYYETFYWCKDFNLIEEEAPVSIYTEIRNRFLNFYNRGYYKYIPDSQIFTFEDTYDICCLTIMGNAEVTKGISFYLSDEPLEYFKLTHSTDSSITDFSLNESISLYYEDDHNPPPLLNAIYHNNFGKDNLVTSIYNGVGVQTSCYLSYSLGLKILHYFDLIDLKFHDFAKSQQFKALNKDVPNIIRFFDDGVHIDEHNMYSLMPDFYFYNFEDYENAIVDNVVIKKSKHYEISLKRASAYVHSNIDPRFTYVVYILLIVDRETKEIVQAFINDEENYNPFISLFGHMKEYFVDHPISGHIHVNTYLDYELVSVLFRDLIDNKKISLTATKGEMLIDEIWEKFDSQIDEIDDNFTA